MVEENTGGFHSIATMVEENTGGKKGFSGATLGSLIAQGSELKCIPVIGLQVIKSINNVPVCLKQCAPLPPSSEAASFVFLPYR